MAWIRTIPAAEARGKLAQLYERYRDRSSGRLDHVLAIHSLHPRGLEAHWAVYRAAMSGTPELSHSEREMIAIVVSRANDCGY